MAVRTRLPSPDVQATAATLLADRHTWRYVRNKETGVSFVAVPSDSGHVYQVRPDGRGCSCPCSQRSWLMCAHRLAVTEANREDMAAEGARLEAMYPAPKSAQQLYVEAGPFGPCCVKACPEPAGGKSRRCRAHLELLLEQLGGED